MLLLGGVMLGFLGSSLVSLWMALVEPNGLQSALFWLLGDLSRARLSGSVFSFFAVAAMCVAIWARWLDLDALLLGEEGAAASGLDVRASRRHLVFLTSVLVSLCVASSGMIGFIGLVIPHFARRLVGAPHRRMLPLCALMGASALTLADALSRALARPYELPVGVVTALVGAPVFLWVMLRSSSTVRET
jgi:iron complex transport system permease protein